MPEDSVAPEENSCEQAELTISIESLGSGGEGIGRHNGKAIFVPGTVAGDVVRVVLTKQQPKWSRARLVEVVEPGEGRVQPVCPLAGNCGGCQWLHLDGGRQQAARVEILRDALQRIGGLSDLPPVDFIESGDGFGYRRKAILHGQARLDGIRMGFYAARSHAIVEHDSCPLLVPALDQTLSSLRAHLAGATWNGGNFQIEATQLADRSQLLLRVESRDAARWRERLSSWRPDGDQMPVIALRALDKPAVFIEPKDAPYLLEEVVLKLDHGIALQYPLYTRPGDFVQANRDANRQLIGALIDEVDFADKPWILDLYCGSGNLSIPLALAGARVLGIEGKRTSIRNARRAVRGIKLARARFRAGAAKEQLQLLVDEEKQFPIVVLDPPRKGAPELAGFLDALGVRKILAVSCHPAALARDIRAWADAGFELRSLRVFDFFAQTSQIETLAVLEKRAGGGGQAIAQD